MPNSLKTKFKKLAHDGKITNAECQELIAKLDGHDAAVYDKAYSEGYGLGYASGYASGHADGFADCLEVNT